MKIRILGAPGSGKTYLAKRLSRVLDIPFYELDHFCWKYPEKGYQKPRSEEVRDRKLRQVMERDAWIVDGTYVDEWARITFTQAEVIVVLDPPRTLRVYRILRRWLFPALGLEESDKHHKPGTVLYLVKDTWRYDEERWRRIMDQIPTSADKVHVFPGTEQAYGFVTELQG